MLLGCGGTFCTKTSVLYGRSFESNGCGYVFFGGRRAGPMSVVEDWEEEMQGREWLDRRGDMLALYGTAT